MKEHTEKKAMAEKTASIKKRKRGRPSNFFPPCAGPRQGKKEKGGTKALAYCSERVRKRKKERADRASVQYSTFRQTEGKERGEGTEDSVAGKSEKKKKSALRLERGGEEKNSISTSKLEKGRNRRRSFLFFRRRGGGGREGGHRRGSARVLLFSKEKGGGRTIL